MLTAVALIIAAAFTVLTVTTAVRTLSRLDVATAYLLRAQARAAAEACADEALLQIRRDAAYAGGSFSLDGATCGVTVNGSGGSRTIIARGTRDGWSRTITVGVTRTPYALTSWAE